MSGLLPVATGILSMIRRQRGNIVQQTIFDRLDHEWQVLATAATSRQELSGWAEDDPALAGFVDLAELAVHNAGAPAANADAILAALARRATHDALAARVLLQLLLPGCRALTHRLAWTERDVEERGAAVVAAAYRRIRTYPYANRPARIALNVMLDTAKAVRREHPTNRPVTFDGRDDHDVLALEEPTAAEELLEVLVDAVSAGRLDRTMAQVIILSRLVGCSMDELAAVQGCHPGSLRRRRRHAEMSLVGRAA